MRTSYKIFQRVIWLLVLSLACTGCSEDPAPETTQDEIEVFPSMPGTSLEVQTVSSQQVSGPRIVLKRGDIHYFHKTIEQTLGSDTTGRIDPVSEKVELLLSLKVVEELPVAYRVQVEFHKVLYQSTLGDQKIEYDSATSAVVPPEALPYQGLMNNGFILRLNQSNQIEDVEQFVEFFQRCVSSYPMSMQNALLQNLGAQAQTPQERIAVALSFLDESIALMPFERSQLHEQPFEIGKTWTRNLSRQLPIPLEESISAKIEHVSGDGNTAHLVIGGQLQPQNTQGAISSNAVRTRVLSGEVSGSCSVSLKTGLPNSSRIQREYTLEIASLNQRAVTAQKTVVTSLEAWNPRLR